jgi:hypothetical protein
MPKQDARDNGFMEIHSSTMASKTSKSQDIGEIVAELSPHDDIFYRLVAMMMHTPSGVGYTRKVFEESLDRAIEHIAGLNAGEVVGVHDSGPPPKKRGKYEERICSFDAYLQVVGTEDVVHIINPSVLLENKGFAKAVKQLTISEFGKEVLAVDGTKQFTVRDQTTIAYQLFDHLRVKKAANHSLVTYTSGPAYVDFEKDMKASHVLRIIQSDDSDYKAVLSISALKKLVVPLFSEFEQIEGESLAFEYKKGTDAFEVLVVIAFTCEPARVLCVSHLFYLFCLDIKCG